MGSLKFRKARICRRINDLPNDWVPVCLREGQVRDTDVANYGRRLELDLAVWRGQPVALYLDARNILRQRGAIHHLRY